MIEWEGKRRECNQAEDKPKFLNRPMLGSEPPCSGVGGVNGGLAWFSLLKHMHEYLIHPLRDE